MAGFDLKYNNQNSEITVDELQPYLQSILKHYDEQVANEVNSIIYEVVVETVKDLKSSSPNSGYARKEHYADAWSRHKDGNNGYTIYNKKYQLTHLLENGHDIVAPYYSSKKGKVIGHSPRVEHIRPAYERMKARLEQESKKRLEGLKGG